uniref:3'-5' exonuclease domain-containing protein n=1 Tax=Guillardia theta TaxID=55529 RepID=A0A7S4P0U2_GUITH|mmetsp:Transcript_40822/g.128593  ORF Transcript_40822/g.128593 Transcript_40822/m.128593 type:complete len:706 (+) Transcript_40822:71-2188(+)
MGEKVHCWGIPMILCLREVKSAGSGHAKTSGPISAPPLRNSCRFLKGRGVGFAFFLPFIIEKTLPATRSMFVPSLPSMASLIPPHSFPRRSISAFGRPDEGRQLSRRSSCSLMCLRTPVEETRGGKPDLLSRWVLKKIQEASGQNKKLAALEKVLMNLEMTHEDIFDCFYVVASRSYTKNVDQAIKIFIKVFMSSISHPEGIRVTEDGADMMEEPEVDYQHRKLASKFVIFILRGQGRVSPKVVHSIIRSFRISSADLKVNGLVDQISHEYITREVDLVGYRDLPPALISFLQCEDCISVQDAAREYAGDGNWNVAETLIRLMGNGNDRSWFVKYSIDSEQYKVALRLAEMWEVGSDEDGVSLLDQAKERYKQQQILKLLKNKMIEGAVTYVMHEENDTLRDYLGVFLFHQLCSLRNFELADKIRSKFQLESQCPPVDNDLIRESIRKIKEESKKYLRIPPKCKMLLVNSPSSLVEASLVLDKLDRESYMNHSDGSYTASDSIWSYTAHLPPAIGIDAEWKPIRRTNERNRVSLMQISVGDPRSTNIRYALIVDLQTLYDDKRVQARELEEAKGLFCQSLKNVVENSKIVKLGFELRDDIRKIRQVGADMTQVFSQVNGVFDLSHWAKSSRPRTKKYQSSLAGLSREVLDGAELNKEQAMSDWSQRPLSAPQLRYAALDALVLLPLFKEAAKSSSWEEALQTWKA